MRNLSIDNCVADITEQGIFECCDNEISELFGWVSAYAEMTHSHPTTMLKLVFEQFDFLPDSFEEFCDWADDILGLASADRDRINPDADKRSRILNGLFSSLVLAMKHMGVNHVEMCELLVKYNQWERMACFGYDYAADGVVDAADSIEAWLQG